MNEPAQDVNIQQASGRGTISPPTLAGAGSVTYSMEIPPGAMRDLQDLAERENKTWAQIISKALVVYKAMADARGAGKAVGIAPNAEALETEFVGIGS